MAEIQPQYFDLKTLSKYSCISVGALRDYISDGDLPAYRLKGKILVKRSTFEEWVAAHPFEQDIDAIAADVIESLKAGESNK